MSSPEQPTLRSSLFELEGALSQLKEQQAQHSTKYQEILKQLRHTWTLLKKTHAPDAFLPDLAAVQ